MSKKIIVTGCNGQLGRAINKLMAPNTEYELINSDVDTIDITNTAQVMELARTVKPYAIVNCAAHTKVDLCEQDRDNAFRINVMGPKNLAVAANEVGAKMVQISTDYVFSGEANHPYREFDEVHPMSVYGWTKLEGERAVKDFSNRYFILRTAWLYGEGNNFAKTMLRLAETRDKIRVVKDQFGTPTSADELARAIAYLVETDNYGTFHATCEGECSWAEFAKEIFRVKEKNVTVEAVMTEEYMKDVPAQAHRPMYSVLENYMFEQTTDFRFLPWEEAFAQYAKTI